MACKKQAARLAYRLSKGMSSLKATRYQGLSDSSFQNLVRWQCRKRGQERAALEDDFRTLGISEIVTELPKFNQFLLPWVAGPAGVPKNFYAS